MSLFSDLVNLFSQANSVRDNYTGISIQEMYDYINAESQLRFYVDGSPNFGHQASTINIMKRLIDATGYNKSILIVYQTATKAGDSTPNKLAVLLTGLIPANIDTATIAYGTCTNIKFLNLSAAPGSLALARFGFTGGADSNSTDYAAKLNVTNFLRLQPYLWSKAPNQVLRPPRAPFSLDGAEAPFSTLAYKFTPAASAAVDQGTWTWYTATQVFDADLAIRTANAQAVYTPFFGNAATIDLWPVYGLHQFGRSDDMSLNILLCALQLQATRHKPVVILHFSDPTRARIFDYLTPLAVDLANGNAALPSLTAQITVDLGVGSPFRPKVNLTSFIAQVAALIAPAIAARTPLTLLNSYTGAYNDISAAITAAMGALSGNGVVVISVGAVPQQVYNYFYSQSSLPGIFEGQNTSSLVISQGRPFLQVPKPTEDDAQNYPSTLNAINYTPIAEQAKAAVLSLRNQTIDSYMQQSLGKNPVAYGVALGAVATFIQSAVTPSNAINTYFAGLGTYYQKDIHDKLMMGLVAVDALLLTGGGMMARLAATEPMTLDKIYSQLTAAWSDGSVNLLSALPDSYLSKFFSAVTGNLFSVAVAQTDITEDKDGTGKVVKVSIANATTKSFLGQAMTITLDFTADAGPISTTITAATNQQWSLDGVPWIVLKNPGFTMTVNEGGLPVQGGITGTISQGGNDVDLMVTYPVADNAWLLGASFTGRYPSISTIYQAAGGINLTQTLPPPLNALAGFGLKSMQLQYNPTTTSFDYMSYTMSTVSPWTLSQSPAFSIMPTVNVAVFNVTDVQNRKVIFDVTGSFTIGAGTITVTGGYPGYEIYGGLDDGQIELSDLLALFGGTLNLDTSVTSFNFDLNPPLSYYQVGAVLEADKPLVIASIFSIDNLSFNVVNDGASNAISLGGQITVLPDSQKIVLQLSANYATGNGWTFTGKQTGGALAIGDLLAHYIDPTWTPPAALNLSLSGLSFTIATATSYWEFGAQTAKPWLIPFLNLSISGKAMIGYGIKGSSKTPGKYGTISADINWNGVELNVFYDYNPGYEAYGIRWNMLEGKVSPNGQGHQVASLTFTQSTTVGSIVETFVSWATGSKFGLSSPWDLLNDIPLNNLSLTYDFTDKTVGFTVGIGPIDFGFAQVKGITISYESGNADPDQNGVMITLDITSAFGDVPTWNAAKPETTPAPPGQGNKYLDLRLLAMGQHVTFAGFESVTTVQEAIACMEDMPTPKPGELPAVTLDPNGSWLVGMDFGVLRLGDDKSDKSETAVMLLGEDAAADAGSYFLTLQIVFNDPNLYALRIALDGAPAKIFKGLDFQIMYKKVSDTVGVYMAQIALPDAMRQIKMGAFNITLPIFAIQVYTNGDFQVDIGFPWNQDFSRSLTFQGWVVTPIGPIPVMGGVGLYFGKLSSATTNRVPQTNTGTFNPVLVFGFGIQFGFGFSFNAGILNAGFSLTAIAILEGLLAKWNPYQLPAGPSNNQQLETSYYFWFRGTVGIIGKLYGSIDFAIIKADLNIDIRIIAQMTFASYEPIVLSLTASVDVSLTITINLGIFKIHISFSFSARISQSVTIAAIGGPAPWASTQSQLRSGMLQRPRLLLAEASIAETIQSPVWTNLTAAQTPVTLPGYLGMGLTVAGDMAANTGGQVACYVAMLFLQSVPPPQGDSKTIQTQRLEAAVSATDTSFEALCKMVFRWLVASIQTGAVTSAEVDGLPVTRDQLRQLQDFLGDPGNPVPLSYSTIEAFIKAQFLISITAEQDAGDVNGTYFPVPNDMTVLVPAYGTSPQLTYSFGSYNTLSSGYISNLAATFNQLAVLQQKQAGVRALADSEDTTSLSNFLFCDYFLILCRQMLQAGIGSLRNYKYPLQTGDTPTTIVKWVATNGEAGYTIQELFADNANAALTTGKPVQVAGSTYQVQSGDGFTSISGQSVYSGGFNGSGLALQNGTTKNILMAGAVITYKGKPYPVLPGQSLSDVATAVNSPSVQDLIDNSDLTTSTVLLVPVATLSIPAFNHTVATGDTLKTIGAQFNVTTDVLASSTANAGIADLFAGGGTATLDLVQLIQFNVGAILAEIQATQGLQHIAGMVSRYTMAGLRLPTAGITPKYKGMWVSDTMTLPNMAGLYALTGQQFAIPALTATDTLTLTFGATAGWMTFTGTTPQQAIVSIVPKGYNANQVASLLTYATTTRLDTLTSFIGMGGAFNRSMSTFPFTSEIQWNSASVISMPYGAIPPGVPSMRIWQLPDTLLQLPDPSRASDPIVQPYVGQYDQASGAMENTEVNYYSYATRLEFSIKKIPVIAGSSSTQTTYEIAGADGTNADILEKMVAGIGTNDSLLAGLFIGYSVDPNSSTPQGIQTDDPSVITMGIAKVNLSTDTRPGMRGTQREAILSATQAPGLLNTRPAFLNLLWEASVTRAGGFFLYYYNGDSAAGLPDSIFNDKNEATLQLVVLYSSATAPNSVTEYMNSFVTAQAIDMSTSVLFAQANPTATTVAGNSTLTLAGLAYSYFETAGDVATDNAAQPLRTGTSLQVDEGVYEVGPGAPGGDLAAIATYFSTTQQAIMSANPAQTSWPSPLPLFTSLRLPELTIVVGTSPSSTTFAAIQGYYGQNISSLGGYNQNVAGIFADSATITLSGGPSTRSATVPAGVAAMQVVRTVPDAVPADPSDPNFAKLFLLNSYSLLSLQLVDNAAFNSSPLGLPTGPTTVPTTGSGNDKIRMPMAQAPGENWTYQQSIPYSRFAKGGAQAASGLPDPGASPYRGLGQLLNVNFSWQDYYGNQLITTLSQPLAGDSGALNQPPALTGYTDPILGLNQWPSVSSDWLVNQNSVSKAAQLEFQINFDSSPYEGLNSIAATSSTTIVAGFTRALDPVSAQTISNYTLQQAAGSSSQTITIQSIALTNAQTVTLTVSQINTDPSMQLSLTIGNINSSGNSQTFSGIAKFYPAGGAGSQTPVIDSATRDLQVYTSLWYQLNDPNGVAFSISCSLLTSDLLLNEAQSTQLSQTWLNSIYLYIADRATGGTTVAAPAAQNPVDFPIDLTALNTDQIIKLQLSFSITRTGGAVAGDFETTGGIKQVSTSVAAYAEKNGTTYSFETFAQLMEANLQVAGQFVMRVASGVDRTEPNSSTGGRELWAVRTALDKKSAIGYQLNDKDNPALFAPRPISNMLESRKAVPIYDFNPATGIDFTKQSRSLDFSGIDMDQWGKLLFTTVDQLLSPEFTAAIQLVDNNQKSTYYTRLLANKLAFAEIVKKWMIPVYKAETADPTVAQEAFRQLLLVQLANAYAANAAVQFEAAVQAQTPSGIAPRLYGAVTMNFRLVGGSIDTDDTTKIYLFFNSELSSTVAATTSNYTASGGLIVNGAALDADNARKVVLQLSGPAIAATTTITVNAAFTDNGGDVIQAPLVATIQTTVNAGNYSNSISITTSKLDLAPVTAAPLAFLVSSPSVVKDVDKAVVPYIDLDLSYGANSIEHQIVQLSSDSDYQASSWLSFLTTAGNNTFGAELGKFRIPMFLRNFPATPSMDSQAGKASTPPTGMPDFDSFLNWDYTITYSEPFHFPQDTHAFTVNFNVMDTGVNRFYAMLDAFGDLAEFVTVLNEISPVFMNSLAPITAATPGTASNFADSSIALNAFNQVLERIVANANTTGMTMPPHTALRGSNTADPYIFCLLEDKETVYGVDALVISLSEPVPSGISDPCVELDGYKCNRWKPTPPNAYSFYFTDPKGNILTAAAGQQIPARQIVLPKLNILQRQDAETTVVLKRNVELVPGNPSADPFVYSTGVVGFPNNYHPTLSNSTVIDMSLLGATGGQHNVLTLSGQLGNLFSALLAKNTQPVLFFQMNCGYEFSLNAGLDPVAQPVFMQPLTGVEVMSGGVGADLTLEQMVANWTGAIKLWYANYFPSTASAGFTFDLTVFSNLTEQPLPLLRLTNLSLDLVYITDLPAGS
jgi:LysM repeat protein